MCFLNLYPFNLTFTVRSENRYGGLNIFEIEYLESVLTYLENLDRLKHLLDKPQIQLKLAQPSLWDQISDY